MIRIAVFKPRYFRVSVFLEHKAERIIRYRLYVSSVNKEIGIGGKRFSVRGFNYKIATLPELFVAGTDKLIKIISVNVLRNLTKCYTV